MYQRHLCASRTSEPYSGDCVCQWDAWWFHVQYTLPLGVVFNFAYQDEWLECQRNWLYLESIFSAPDIQRQLPNEAKMFIQVDKSWKEIMRHVHKLPNALRAATRPGVCVWGGWVGLWCASLSHIVCLSVGCRLTRLLQEQQQATGGDPEVLGGVPHIKETGIPEVGLRHCCAFPFLLCKGALHC